MSTLKRRVAKLETAAAGDAPGEFAHLTDDELMQAIAIEGRVWLDTPAVWPAFDRECPGWRETVEIAEAYRNGRASLADCFSIDADRYSSDE